MKTIYYKTADGETVQMEVSDEVAEYLQEEKRYNWKIHKREKRHESIATIEQREENGEQVTLEVEPSALEQYIENEDENERERLKSLLPQAISMLTPKQQLLLQKVIFEGVSQRSIAEDEGVLETACSMRMSRIYGRLKNILKKL